MHMISNCLNMSNTDQNSHYYFSIYSALHGYDGKLRLLVAFADI